MKRHDADLVRAERLAWDRALGRHLNAADHAFLHEYASRAPDGEGPSERVTTAVRKITHGHADVATGAERRAMFEEVMARREGRRSRSRPNLRTLGWAGAAAAAALAVFLLVPPDAPLHTDQEPSEHVAVRGDHDTLPVVGLGISGVDPAGGEYEVVHGEGLCATDAMRFYLTVRDERTPHYVLFGVQELEDPTWYVPMSGDTTAPALPEVPARTWMVPFEIEADGTHVPGLVSVVCILSEEPIHFTRLQAAWRDADGDVSSRAAQAAAMAEGAVRILVEEIEIIEDCGRRP